MKKILATTDLSENSKAGLKFAIQLASQLGYELTVLHVYNIMKPSSWHEERFYEYEKNETEKMLHTLKHFADGIYKSIKIPSNNNKCIILNSVYTGKSIREYAAKNNFSFICISTRGAGKIKKIMGTNTSDLIIYSDTPVIAVPGNYHKNPITNILYASDLVHLEKEVKMVVAFAKLLKAKIELLHLNSPNEIILDTKIIDVAVKKFSKYDIKLKLENCDPMESFILNIEKSIAQSNPSMLIMFSEKNRTFLQRLFTPSKTAEYSFTIKVPMLVFKRA